MFNKFFYYSDLSCFTATALVISMLFVSGCLDLDEDLFEGIGTDSNDSFGAEGNNDGGNLEHTFVEASVSPLIVPCGVASIGYSTACGDGYHYAEYTCEDGRQFSEGVPGTCVAEADWANLASQKCDANCIALIDAVNSGQPEGCELMTYHLADECAGGFESADYACADGSMFSVERSSCRSEAEWLVFAANSCAGVFVDGAGAGDTELLENCELVHYDIVNECDGGFHHIMFNCTDGMKYLAGETGICQTSDALIALATETCMGLCGE